MKQPKNTKEVRAFIGIVNWYMDMWIKRSHLLHPLTELKSHKVMLKWTNLEQKDFGDIKCAVSQDTLLVYPDFNKHFDIYTDVSDCQLGVVIIHNGKKNIFYSRKLTGPQTRYAVTEKELISIVETLKKICTILLGQALKDHIYYIL